MFPSCYRIIGFFLGAFVFLMQPVCTAADPGKAVIKEPVRIDFSDVVEDDRNTSQNPARPEIRIAVAAMISPKYTYQYYIELLTRIGDALGRTVVFIQKKTYGEVNRMMERKELDLAFVCSGPYVSGKKAAVMEILVVPVCHGETVYYSYFITSVKSDIDSFCELKGKTFAFTDPLSNSGYLVPTYYLAKRKETQESYFKKTFFTHSHDNSIRAVADGIADGAAVDSLIYTFMQKRDPEKTDKTRVIETSPPYGIPPVVVPPSIDPILKERLRSLFLHFHEMPEGKDILKKLMIDRFVEGRDEAYDSVRDLLKFLDTKRK